MTAMQSVVDDPDVAAAAGKLDELRQRLSEARQRQKEIQAVLGRNGAAGARAAAILAGEPAPDLDADAAKADVEALAAAVSRQQTILEEARGRVAGEIAEALRDEALGYVSAIRQAIIGLRDAVQAQGDWLNGLDGDVRRRLPRGACPSLEATLTAYERSLRIAAGEARPF